MTAISAENPPKSKQKSVRGRPRDTSKNKAIIHSASRLFLEKGFDGTSMDDIAKRAGVSKQTVYSHFACKEVLCSEAISLAVKRYSPDTALENMEEHSLEADLRAVCDKFARLLLGDDSVAMANLLVTSAPKGSEFAKIYWNAGPQAMHGKLKDFLQHWIDQGALSIDDTSKAADLLATLLKGKVHFLRSIGLMDTISEEQIQENVEDTVTIFLKLYGAKI